MNSQPMFLTWTTLVLFLLIATANAAESPAAGLIDRGDRFYGKREKGRKWVEKAVGCYEKALVLDPESVEASWKYAQAAIWVASKTEAEEEKLRILNRAIDVSKRAIRIDEKSVEAHYWLGIGFARYGEAKGVMNALALVRPLKKQMRRVIELDDAFAGGGAYRILGWISHKLPGVAGGSDEEAVKLLEKALEKDPGHLLTHLCLAEIYRVNDQPKQARSHLDTIRKAPLTEERRPEEIDIKAAAKQMQEEMAEDSD